MKRPKLRDIDGEDDSAAPLGSFQPFEQSRPRFPQWMAFSY
jgi:hypothetical protein